MNKHHRTLELDRVLELLGRERDREDPARPARNWRCGWSPVITTGTRRMPYSGPRISIH